MCICVYIKCVWQIRTYTYTTKMCVWHIHDLSCIYIYMDNTEKYALTHKHKHANTPWRDQWCLRPSYPPSLLICVCTHICAWVGGCVWVSACAFAWMCVREKEREECVAGGQKIGLLFFSKTENTHVMITCNKTKTRAHPFIYMRQNTRTPIKTHAWSIFITHSPSQ